MTTRSIVLGLMSTVLLTPWLPAGVAADAPPNPPRRTIQVSGHGEVLASPDSAEVHLGVSTEGPTARDAMVANSKQVAQVMERLRKLEVAAKDLQTSGLSVTQEREGDDEFRKRKQQDPRVVRQVTYRVLNGLRIVVRDLDNLGPVLDAAVDAGTNQVHGVWFRIEDRKSLERAAREAAILDAQARAELLATRSGVQVGAPFSITEGGSGPLSPYAMGFPAPVAMAPAAIAPAPSAPDAAEFAPPPPGFTPTPAPSSVPVAPGEQAIAVDLLVVYEIKLPD